MRVLPLGGAGEVGASSAILEIAGARLLMDVGIRVGSGAARPLPMLELLTTPPDAVILTHAHTDHTGALPVVVSQLGEALIHMTTASLHLVEVLQGDAVRAREADDRRDAQDGDAGAAPGAASYTMADVEAAISRVQGHAFFTPFCPVPGRTDIVCTYLPCGHILGAAMVCIDTPEARVLWTGDYSVTPQPTIGGVDLDALARLAAERPIDLMVSEGTYGTARHPAREAETRRFLGTLEKITRQGGKVLIPAFAVGRAQDIVHTIREAKREGRLAGVPVLLDGMVRPVTSIYENIAHECYPHLQAPLVLVDPTLDITKATNASRARLLAEPAVEGPAIVIASSGMLIGGRSVQYAQAFAQDRRNAILISGYQDEESPGRALLGVRRGGRLRFGDGTRITLKCQVGRYHTSAHADGDQILAVMRAANPRQVAFVHGEAASLNALAAAVTDRPWTIFANGVPFDYTPTTPPVVMPTGADAPQAAALAPAPHLGQSFARAGVMPSEPSVRALWEYLQTQGIREYTESEIAQALLGPGYTSGQREALAHCLTNYRLYFVTGARIGSRSYRPRATEEVIDMMVERQQAWSLPLALGDVVVYSDGSPDLFVAGVVKVDGPEVEVLVPFAARSRIRREWVRCQTGIAITALLERGPSSQLLRSLEGLVKEARALPTPDPLVAYLAARVLPAGRLDPAQAAALFWPQRDGMYSTAMRLASALVLAGARAFFRVAADGGFTAREPADVAARAKPFARAWHVQTTAEGTPVQLTSGEWVTPVTRPLAAEAFDALDAQGLPVRVAYRRVLLPGETLFIAPPPPPPIMLDDDLSGARRTRRRHRKGASTAAGPAAGPMAGKATRRSKRPAASGAHRGANRPGGTRARRDLEAEPSPYLPTDPAASATPAATPDRAGAEGRRRRRRRKGPRPGSTGSPEHTPPTRETPRASSAPIAPIPGTGTTRQSSTIRRRRRRGGTRARLQDLLPEGTA